FYRCNMWHVQGRERDVLVDSGSGLVSLREQLPWLTERPLLAVLGLVLLMSGIGHLFWRDIQHEMAAVTHLADAEQAP
ncbi:hypothetical protein R4J70_32120, partial [Pseudomonas aeruginosa]|nr:hypothetical protein [Pseudomonas aeruginosa]